MKTKELLEQTQPILMQTLNNSFREQKISHAYLISGQKGLPLKEVAYFIAKSILCDSPNPLACEECLTCRRIENGSYTDFMFLDGNELGSIKKEDIEHIQYEFSQTANEEKEMKIYIIHLVEKATTKAINQLLKFVEDPSPNTVAIFTTENVYHLLPTLISRCQVLHLRNYEKKELIEQAIKEGLSEEDAGILADNYSSLEEILDVYQNTPYVEIKDLVIDTMDVLAKKSKDLLFFEIQELGPRFKGPSERSNCKLYLDLLTTILKDVLKLSLGQEVIFKEQKKLISSVKDKNFPIDKFITNIMLNEHRLDAAVANPTVLDTIFIEMLEGVN